MDTASNYLTAPTFNNSLPTPQYRNHHQGDCRGQKSFKSDTWKDWTARWLTNEQSKPSPVLLVYSNVCGDIAKLRDAYFFLLKYCLFALYLAVYSGKHIITTMITLRLLARQKQTERQLTVSIGYGHLHTQSANSLQGIVTPSGNFLQIRSSQAARATMHISWQIFMKAYQ